ncbi:MAG: hypothetical protein F6J98_15705 [Moorea sp. SIO4G2]|nr:hypothetical protein [Moorena sp. SIO4G2]
MVTLTSYALGKIYNLSYYFFLVLNNSNWHQVSNLYLRESGIGNRESGIGNRESGIGNSNTI